MTPDTQNEQKEMWALVELFGHNRIAGKVSEAEIGAGALIRVDVPAVKDREPLTKYYNVKSIYALTPVDESTARRMAESIEAAPVNSYSIDREIERRKRLTDGDSEEYDEGI
jgi:hypothetical protein